MDKSTEKRKQGIIRKITNIRDSVREAFSRVFKWIKGRTEKKRNTLREINRKIEHRLEKLELSIIKEKQRSLIVNAELLELAGTNYTSELFKGGIVDALFIPKEEIVEISDGWSMERFMKTESTEKFFVTAKTGCKIPIHNHKQEKTIKINSGTVVINLINLIKPDEKVLKMELSQGDIIHIEPFKFHELICIDDAEMIFNFHPPISINE